MRFGCFGSTAVQRRHGQDGPHLWVKRKERVRMRKSPLEPASTPYIIAAPYHL